MRVLGIDPGTSAGWCLLDGGQLMFAGSLQIKNNGFRQDASSFWFRGFGVQRIVVEGQECYEDSPVPPKSLIRLAQIAGFLWGTAANVWPEAEVLIPLPKDWKGQVPKGVCHRRWRRKVPDIDNFLTGKKSDLDVLDALGLALWGLKI